MNQTIRLVTNVGKTQISDDGEFFKLSRIPVTVDDAVMNGLHYPSDENEKGIPSLAGRVMTLGHPKSEAGEHVSASDGDALVNQFSGGSVSRTYLANGVHYVDAKIRKSTLKAQPNGEWFYNQLENQKPIGVSTGLFSRRELKEGVNNSGKQYKAIARNQRYDHLALLHESEPPAGGKDTFINFNAEDTDITINVDDYISGAEESLIERIVNRVSEIFGNKDETRYNQEDGDEVATNLNTNEDDAHMRKFIIDQLAAKGISVNAEATDEQLQAELTKALATNSAPVGGEEVPAWAQALTANMAAMSKKVDDMEKTKLSAEEEAKAKKAKAIAANESLGMTEDEAKLLPNSLLDKFYAQCGGITGNAHSGFGGRQSDSVAEMDLNKLIEGAE